MPFELGRPLGVPNDPDFQKRVMLAAFELLDAAQGPLLVDYPEDVPETSGETDEDAMAGMVCPLDLPKVPDQTAPRGALADSLMQEIAALAPWYDLAVRRRGRTTVGPSGLSTEHAARYLLAFIEDPTVEPPIKDVPYGWALKLAFEDVKAFYSEAITVQPGFATSKRVEDWLFNETVLGKISWLLRALCSTIDDDICRRLGRSTLVPDRQISPPNEMSVS
ncbi:MAG: hypothetical protein V3U27_05065 [Candidatus Tectomicrobia bacterium]